MNNRTNITSASIKKAVSGLLTLALLLSCSSAFSQSDKGQNTFITTKNKQPSERPVFSSAHTEHIFCTQKGDCGSTHTTLVTSAIDDRTPSDHLIYTYQIDLESDGVFDKKGEGRDASGNYPLGRHSIEWTVEDESGNIALSKYEFTIRDCQAPKAYCVNGKSVELASREAGLRVWANDLDLSSMDNCGITELRIASPSAGPGQSIPPPANDYVVFGCQSVGVQSVDVWVKDEGDNWDYCTTYLHVSDRKQLCPTEKAVETTAPTQVSGEVEGTNPRLGFGHNAAASSSLEGFQLFQNYPNPFEEQTTIRFHLPEAASATLTIYDLTGKVVKTIGGNYTSGFHNVELKKSDLAGQQVLYYQLDTDLYSASMKMLLVD